jgi:hypothetical protein
VNARRRCLFSVLLVLACAPVGQAIPLSQYHEHVGQAIAALDLLMEKQEVQNESQRGTLVATTLSVVREALPKNESVEWNGTTYNVNNAWLEAELKEFEVRRESDPERANLLGRILERLHGIEERLREIEKQSATTAGKTDLKERLAAILQRPEYAGNKPKGQSAIGRLLERFAKWLRSLLPDPPQISPGRAGSVSRGAQVIVVGIALAVIAYALWLLAPRLLRGRKTRKKVKPEARIVLGERIEPDQSAVDLLAGAEALARAGDLRGAIRKGYIALLVELGDRKIVSLAQHKTNQDYLRAVRELEPLHRHMEKLTYSFEVHWYGLAQASEHDWLDFRAVYREALRG